MNSNLIEKLKKKIEDKKGSLYCIALDEDKDGWLINFSIPIEIQYEYLGDYLKQFFENADKREKNN